jgi:hypothetical protein
METSVLNWQHTETPNLLTDILPRPRASRKPKGYHRPEKPGAMTFPLDAQAACGFTYSASKRAPFFQSVNVMAAILRASVRRANSGFIPLASRPS